MSHFPVLHRSSLQERDVWGYQALRPLSASCILTASQRAAINWQRVAGLQLSVTQHSTWDTILCRMVSWLDSCSPTIKLIKTRVFSPATKCWNKQALACKHYSSNFPGNTGPYWSIGTQGNKLLYHTEPFTPQMGFLGETDNLLFWSHRVAPYYPSLHLVTLTSVIPYSSVKFFMFLTQKALINTCSNLSGRLYWLTSYPLPVITLSLRTSNWSTLS